MRNVEIHLSRGSWEKPEAGGEFAKEVLMEKYRKAWLASQKDPEATS